MKKVTTLCFAILLAAPALAGNALRPENFAYRSTITPGAGAPFQQLVLPLAVYQGSTRPDLADLRVFNGQGEVLPYALQRSRGQSEALLSEKPVPFFPLQTANRTPADTGDISVSVRQGRDGTLVAVRQSAGQPATEAAPRGAVIDASQLKNVRSLRLVVGPSKLSFHPYTIDSSDDLQNWHVLKADAQLVHLEHAGQRVDRNSAEWSGNAGKYLRLLWADPQQAPAIQSVLLGTVETKVDQPQRIWSDPLPGAVIQANTYEYALPGQLPLEKLRINLPQINSLAPVDIQREGIARSRHHHRQPPENSWGSLAHTVVYRLQSPLGEVASADISLSGGVEHRLRLVLDGRSGGIGATPPSLQVGFVPQVLVFLARGEGPYVLAWGANDVEPAALPVATLLPGYDGRSALPAATASLVPLSTPAQAAPVASAAAPVTSSKWLLWSVLLVGLLVLASMARTLTRHISVQRQSANNVRETLLNSSIHDASPADDPNAPTGTSKHGF